MIFIFLLGLVVIQQKINHINLIYAFLAHRDFVHCYDVLCDFGLYRYKSSFTSNVLIVAIESDTIKSVFVSDDALMKYITSFLILYGYLYCLQAFSNTKKSLHLLLNDVLVPFCILCVYTTAAFFLIFS